MRVMLMLHGLPIEKMGGVGLYVKGVISGLQQQGATVALLAPVQGEQWKVSIKKEAWGLIYIVEQPPLRQWKETWHRPQVDLLLKTALHNWGPDILHIHHHNGLSLHLHELLPQKTKVVITLHDYALPCARGQLFRPHFGICSGPTPADCSACLSRELSHSPFTSFVGNLLQKIAPNTEQKISSSLDQRKGTFLGRWRLAQRAAAVSLLLQKADLILSPSVDLSDRFEQMGLPKPRLQELPLLIPVQPTQATGKPHPFLFASSLIKTKGIEVLLEAFKELNPEQASLTIAGGGARSYVSQLKRSYPEHSWLGPVPHEQIPDLLTKHRTLILPSLWPENSPLIIREAAQAGLSIICSSEGGASELAPKARLVPPSSVTALISAIKKEILTPTESHRSTFPTVQEHSSDLLDLYSTLLH